MLLILSNKTDHSTSAVIKWLLHYKTPFRRINGEDDLLGVNIIMNTNEGIRIVLNGQGNENYDLSHFESFWYRRGDLQIVTPVLSISQYAVINTLKREWHKLKEFIYYQLLLKKHLGNLSKERDHLKLQSLDVARSVGLRIPDTYVLSDKRTANLLATESEFITKAIDNLYSLTINNRHYASCTEMVNMGGEDVEEGILCCPFLVQRYVKKKLELRIFFLQDKLFPMAIFSQRNDKTMIDYRNYDNIKPNRNVPYILSKEHNTKVLNFIQKIGMDTGSIDIIVTPENDLVFLEVNHLGQFGWLSHNCNYFIEKHIAQYFNN
ncbi:MAG: grasp-with-spasm system ATP-grasp peptide maturase [Saprospiraceae bacterium]|nr:grasp-with-spasm system ATP-grasp peptide maturase [Saprospiraceae bacterium]MBP7679484.1 grasp-with-spasm system ATP-grasp peptide maturase [Saprospiraceae bacterium]